jgi:hypothetical protein
VPPKRDTAVMLECPMIRAGVKTSPPDCSRWVRRCVAANTAQFAIDLVTRSPALLIHRGRTNPSVVARVLRTSNNTRIIPTKGTNPAVMIIESKECVARD